MWGEMVLVFGVLFVCREVWVWNGVVWGVGWDKVRGMCVVEKAVVYWEWCGS